MNPDMTLTLLGEAISLMIKLALVLIVPSLVAGLIIAVIQAVTQVNEQTLSFLPKLIVILITIGLTGTWVMRELVTFSTHILEHISTISA